MEPLDYRQRFALVTERVALEKLAVAIANVARDVYVELDTTPSHTLRMSLVSHAGPETEQFEAFARRMSFLVFALNPLLTKDSADQDYYDAVESLWTPFAALLQARGTISA